MCPRKEAVEQLRKAACDLSRACLAELLGERSTALVLVAPEPELAELMKRIAKLR
jgi:hypothetical protein